MSQLQPEEPASASRAPGTRFGGRGVNANPWNLLLLVPLLGVLVPAFYNKRTPTLFDIPFFYWYQLLWIPISVACTIAVYRATRGER